MNDLISRKEVVEILDEFGYVNCQDGKDYESNSRVDKCRQRILEMPITYDINGVIEKLEQSETEILLAMEQMGRNPNVSVDELFLVGNSNLIMLGRYKEIVKSGWRKEENNG